MKYIWQIEYHMIWHSCDCDKDIEMDIFMKSSKLGFIVFACFIVLVLALSSLSEEPRRDQRRATLLCGYSFSVHSRAATVLFIPFSWKVNILKVVSSSKCCGVYLYVILIWPLRIDQKCFLPTPNEPWSSSPIIYLIYIRNAMCG